MSDVRTITLTPQRRASALHRVYARSPRTLRVSDEHLRYLAQVDARRQRRTAARLPAS
jgi:hypothetical protein